MKVKQQIGGFLTLAALLAMAGISGWWFITRGGVIDRVKLFSQTKVTTAKIGRITTTLGIGENQRGAWELGPYKLTPEDSPVNITGSFTATGELAKRKPTFTLKGYLFDEAGEQVWKGQSKISLANRKSDSDVSSVSLNLGTVPIRKAGDYMLYCNTNEEFSTKGGVGTGTMKLDLVLRKNAKSFPFIPVGGAFVVLLIAIFGFGESVKQ